MLKTIVEITEVLSKNRGSIVEPSSKLINSEKIKPVKYLALLLNPTVDSVISNSTSWVFPLSVFSATFGCKFDYSK